MAKRLVILGAGGHAKMVIEAAISQGHYEPTLCLAPDIDGQRLVLGIPVAQETEDQLIALQSQAWFGFVAIGDNGLRRKLTEKLQRLGIPLATIVASSAWLSPSARLEEGSVLMPHAVVGAEAHVERGSIINTSASVDHDCHIGAFAHIAPGSHLGGCVRVGDESFLGLGTSVIPEMEVGRRSIIGSGAVVVSSIPDNEVWVGCPARFMKSRS